MTNDVNRMGNTSFQSDPYSTPRATAIYRVIEGEAQIVFVCESCDDIHTITVQEAMHRALSSYVFAHRQERHPGVIASAVFPNYREEQV